MAEDIIEQFDKLYEFDREPVSPDRLQSGRYFAAVFAGEHVAGTEFVIGALFVQWGATARDIFLGLLIGNLFAVLSWTLICAPIATQTRLTLYWYLRRIAGPVVTTFYNILNAILFCILSGAMITVSASAIRIPFNIPAQTKWYPEDLGFVLVVIAVGAIVVCLAILGFKRLAQFSSICSPWIFAMFFAGAAAMLPALASKTSTLGEVHSLADFWQLAETRIWTGVAPEGIEPLGFWHIVAFAWICNLAMHIGLSDMALLRYAKHSWYGAYSACGMYLGHYLAWVCAGIMGAATAHLLNRPLDTLDPGDVAMNALGISGAIAVVLAGWTTSNPTLYRAGLALQAVTPGWPRWLVTLIAGIFTTAMACSPFVFTKLLGFVAFYGILLMPVGAIVLVEHWIFPRIGLTQFWSSRANQLVNWPALISWAVAIACSFSMYGFDLLHEFFLAIPIWLLTAVLYTVLAALAGARSPAMAGLADDRFKARVPHGSPRSAADLPQAPPVMDRWHRLRLRLFGLVAVASFFACIGLAIWVFVMGTPGYEERFESFKSTLLWVSLVHLASATLWVVEKERYAEAMQS